MKFKSTLIGAFTILVGLGFNSFAQAEIINREFRANKATGIFSYVLFNPDTCGAMAPAKFKVNSVGHGKIAGFYGRVKLESGRCKGRQMKGLVLGYTPNPGFRGSDNAKVTLSMPRLVDDSGHTSKTLDFRIQVK